MLKLQYALSVAVFLPTLVLAQDNSAPPLYPAPSSPAQTQSRQNVEMQQNSETPVFRVKVYARSAKAVNYRNRGGSTTLDIRGTDLMPAIGGRAKVDGKAGRLAIDVTAGLPIAPGWSNRLRRSLFIGTRTALDLPNAIVAFGPFGDVKSYTATDFYVSWYPAGLACDSFAITPPALRPMGFEQEKRLIVEVQTAIGELLPWTSEIFDLADEIMIRGGYVFAQGRGSLADPRSTLHRRDRFGILRHGQYYSVDTGKYSTAPWLAWCLAKELIGESGAGSERGRRT